MKIPALEVSIGNPVVVILDVTSPSTLSAFTSSISGKISEKESKKSQEDIYVQLPFLRVVTDTKEILHVSVGNAVSLIQIKKL